MLGMPVRQLPSKVVAKLEMNGTEVKRRQSLEEYHVASYSSPLSHSNMIDRLIRSSTTRLAFGTAAVVALAAASCKGFTGVPAQLDTITDSGVVYAINGAPSGAPTALHFYSGTLLAADANFIFDLAFDIDSSGNAVLIPMSVVSSGLASTHSVGLQASSETFDQIGSAPKSGYRADTAMVALPGQAVIAQSQDPLVCSSSLTGSTIHAKIVVTSVDPIARQLNIRYTVDPNCGFRSFASGLPKD
jgi:hypothetical protein